MNKTFMKECDLVAVDANPETATTASVGMAKLRTALDRCFGANKGVESFCRLVARFLLHSVQSENRTLIWNNFELDAEHAWIFGFQEHRVYPEKPFRKTFDCLALILQANEAVSGPLFTQCMLACASAAAANPKGSRELLLGLYVFIFDNIIAEWWTRTWDHGKYAPGLSRALGCIQRASNVYPEFYITNMPRTFKSIAAKWCLVSQPILTDSLIGWIFSDPKKTREYITWHVLDKSSPIFQKWFDKEVKVGLPPVPAMKTAPATFAKVFDEYYDETAKLKFLQSSCDAEDEEWFLRSVCVFTERYNSFTRATITVTTFLKTLKWAYCDSPPGYPRDSGFDSELLAWIKRSLWFLKSQK
tara:strand:+ start:2797 stop:3873 length:1077 start_codon:yes stop_codon:yes gene_type:complete